MSTDGTWEAVRRVAAEIDHVEPVRVRLDGRLARARRGLCGNGHVGVRRRRRRALRPGWAGAFRAQLLAGAHREYFSLKSNVLNVTELDRERRTATGYLSPPSRSITKLFNFAAIDSWTKCYRQYMHDGEIAFRPGYDRESIGVLSEQHAWEESPLRCLHVCFLRRSSLDPPAAEGHGRLSPIELGGKRRSWLTPLIDRFRRTPPASPWKDEKYRQGELVTKDAGPFFP